MRWKASSKTDWHRWFAWEPILIDAQWIWLEYVERKGTREDGYDHMYWHWEYR